jgi:hypothetical protein
MAKSPCHFYEWRWNPGDCFLRWWRGIGASGFAWEDSSLCWCAFFMLFWVATHF